MTHKLTQGDQILHVDTLARVEGEGGMHIIVREGLVADVELRIFEPPRFFEAFLRGRAWTEPPDITARICGICPVAYQMSSCLAIEDACGVTVPEELRLMRRLLYCGEWIESHALHIFLLHAPDFLGYQGAIEMAADYGAVVEQGLRLKKAGNALMTLVGGRAVTRSTSGSAASTACRPPRSSATSVPPWSAPATTPSRPSASWPASSSPTWCSPTSTLRCDRRTDTRWRADRWSAAPAAPSRSPTSAPTSWRNTSPGPTRCTRTSTARLRMSWGRWRDTRSTTTSSTPSRARSPTRRDWVTSAETRSSRSSSGPSSSSTRPTRPWRSSTPGTVPRRPPSTSRRAPGSGTARP